MWVQWGLGACKTGRQPLIALSIASLSGSHGYDGVHCFAAQVHFDPCLSGPQLSLTHFNPIWLKSAALVQAGLFGWH